MTPFDFLILLWTDKPDGLYILIWTLQGKRSHWFHSPTEAAEFIATHQTDVYVGVGLAGRDYGPDHRCVSAEVTAIPGLWADFDLKSPAHSKDLPASIEDALALIPASMPPTIVIATGNGVHAWWLFKELWIFENEDERKQAATLASRFQTLLRYNSNQRGFAFERLSDLARVLRIPGTLNGKDPSNPKRVTVHSFGNRRYNPSEIEDYLDDLLIPDAETEKSAANVWKKRFADKSFTINLSARIPQELLERWFKEDQRFEKTWFRQRTDLKDQSQSGYDMALACFGIARHLEDQRIVDLIVHHRFTHRKKPITAIDYLKRTISKAASGSGESASPPVDSESGAGSDSDRVSPEGEVDAVPIDPAIAKAQALEGVSEVLDVRIYRVVKITGKDPIYRMDLEGAKVEFSSIKKLVTQETFRCTIAAATNHLPPKLKPKVWEELARTMLNSLTEEDGGEEMDLEGRARLYVSQYLADTGFIDSVEGQNTQIARKPMILGAAVTVCSSDVQLYVNKTTGQNLSVSAIAAMLSVLGARSFRHRGKFPEQSRWTLPPSDFDPGKYHAGFREDTVHGE